MLRRTLAGLVLMAAFVSVPLAPASGAALALPPTVRIDVGNDGSQIADGVDGNTPPSLSSDGRLVTFVSDADLLVAGDTNGSRDIFVRDVVAGTTTSADLAPDGSQLEVPTSTPVITHDGRYVVFAGHAPAQSGPKFYVHDLLTSVTTEAVIGVQPLFGLDYPISVSSDARFIAFTGYTAAPQVQTAIYEFDMTDATSTLVDATPASQPADGICFSPAVSGDGRYVAFQSTASDLVSTPTDPYTPQVYLRDMSTSDVSLLSVSTGGAAGDGGSAVPMITPDGRYVVFASAATNLVPEGTSGTIGIFLRDLDAGVTTRVDLSSDGNPSAEGSSWPSISDDGRYVAFTTSGRTLIPADIPYTGAEAYVRDLTTGRTKLVSQSSDGGLVDAGANRPVISGDGRYVVFYGGIALVPEDTNNFSDLFERDSSVPEGVPDLSLKASHRAPAGVGVFSSRGVIQRLRIQVPRGGSVSVQVRFLNAALDPDTITGEGRVPQGRVTTTIWEGTTDVTDGFTGGMWQTDSLAPGARDRLTLHIHVASGAHAGSATSISIGGVSLNQSGRRDVIRLRVLVTDR